MILRRLAQGIRQRDWFTVVLEILVVVVGIVLGLQVDDWNANRLERREEAEYLRRLHVDLADYLPAFAKSKERRESHIRNLSSFSDALYGRDPRAELTRDECEAVAASHVLAVYVPDLPVLNEIISSGRMNLLRSDELRTAIVAFQQAKESLLQLIDASRSQSLNLVSRYPELIQAVSYFDAASQNVRTAPTCRLEKMRDSQAFRNDAATNLDIYDAFMNGRVAELSARLQRLHELVESARPPGGIPLTKRS